MAEPRRATDVANRPLIDDFGGLLRAAAHLERVVDKAMRDEAGISHVMFEVLLRLYRAEGAKLPIGSIDLVLTSGGMTRLVDRMTAAGLVRRVPHTTDRRIQMIETTAEAEEVFLRAAAVHERVVERHFVAPLTPQEYQLMTSCLRRIVSGVTI
ncbi:MarR family transcriptional regulator [Streptosporangiaceae bacterium NEAU-GS5]|nr:MarR family transcriptional regulator [Streptosporangiaceae bacterium NEAU-GS5]